MDWRANTPVAPAWTDTAASRSALTRPGVALDAPYSVGPARHATWTEPHFAAAGFDFSVAAWAADIGPAFNFAAMAVPVPAAVEADRYAAARGAELRERCRRAAQRGRRVREFVPCSEQDGLARLRPAWVLRRRELDVSRALAMTRPRREIIGPRGDQAFPTVCPSCRGAAGAGPVRRIQWRAGEPTKPTGDGGPCERGPGPDRRLPDASGRDEARRRQLGECRSVGQVGRHPASAVGVRASSAGSPGPRGTSRQACSPRGAPRAGGLGHHERVEVPWAPA